MHFIEQDRHRSKPGKNAALASDNHSPAPLIWPNERDRRPIVLTAEVLADRETDELAQVVFQRRVPNELVEFLGHPSFGWQSASASTIVDGAATHDKSDLSLH
jgi:hypothetical protein